MKGTRADAHGNDSGDKDFSASRGNERYSTKSDTGEIPIKEGASLVGCQPMTTATFTDVEECCAPQINRMKRKGRSLLQKRASCMLGMSSGHGF